MAITGSGTSTAPYVVHDYWELKNACCSGDYTGMTDGVRYVRLDSDINCNDRAYGDTFEWETINLGRGWSDGSVVDLDLNTKTIKNVMIKNSNSLFCGVRYGNAHAKIHDGKILNIFSNNAAHIVGADSTSSVINCEFENVSWSVNGTTVTGTAFDKCNFNKSSLYYESAKLNNHIIYTYTNECSHSNSDFKFDVKDTCSNQLFYNSYGKSTVDIDNCRISGTVYDNSVEFSYFGNCVFDLECEKYGAWNSYATLFTNCSGIFNTDKASINEYVNLSNMIKASSTDMKNAATLSGKGFNVVNIGG